ncbi:unnamed protein product, partial [Hapterophycus canaliculatus]
GDEDGRDSSSDAGGEARLIRRRSSGGGGGIYGGVLGDNGQSPAPAGGRGRGTGKSKRTLWGIAQGADELSQSNFVTGVFADIRAKHTAAAADRRRREVAADERSRRHGTRRGRVFVTAAAYGDASLYNRRSGSAGTATGAGAAGSADMDVAAHDAATGGTAATADDDDGIDERRRQEYASPVASDADEPNDFDDDENGGGASGADSDDDNASAAMDGAILLLSQTLSASSAAARMAQRREPCAAPGKEQGDEAAEGARVAAERHIGRAPAAALSGLFPRWKENIRFVFRQGAPDLREALGGIVAALSKEGAAEGRGTCGGVRGAGQGGNVEEAR